jgi:hypothetical protein
LIPVKHSYRRFDKADALVVTERDIARGLKTLGRNMVDKPVRQLTPRNVRTCDVGQC